MKYEILLFDLDGTLVDTLEGVVKSAQYALKHFGIDEKIEDMDFFLGPPLRYTFTTHYGFSDEQAAQAIEKYRERYRVYGKLESRLFPCFPAMLDELTAAGYRLGVATSKYENSAVDILSYLGVADRFEYITGSNADETISEKHEVILEALRRFGITEEKRKALMIGDMKYDDIGARKAGIDCCGVYTGTAFPPEHELAGATYVMGSFEELREFLLSAD